MNLKKGDIISFNQIFEEKDCYFALYEMGLKGVQNANWCPKGFWSLYLNGELENYNPLSNIKKDFLLKKDYNLYILSWLRGSKPLQFKIKEVILK